MRHHLLVIKLILSYGLLSDCFCRHSMNHKIIRSTATYKAHDEKNETKTGDTVRIMETRPLSKDKRWVIVESNR